VSLCGVDETDGLLTIDPLGEDVLEEGISHIKLMNMPSTRSCMMKHHADSGGIYDRAKGFTEIDAWSLMKATQDPTCLVAVEGAIGVEVVAEDPLPSDDSATRTRNKGPNPILLERIKLTLRHDNPMWVMKCSPCRGRQGDNEDVEASTT
jgi:hypothetical protein